jgi:hypothetical protein
MKIHELFIKPVDRAIDGVIKADDDRNLRTELEEYVATRDVMRGLNIFADRYLGGPGANGVWISGFFGSGKSHLLKMLSLLLEGRPLPDGSRPSDLLLPKVDDEIVRAGLIKAAAIPSHSLLFNIDQKYDGIGGDQNAAILEVFMKVLNELQGYFAKQGYIAQFEHDLDIRGDLTPFRETYLKINGRPWEQDREAIATARKAAFGRAFAEHYGVPETEAFNVLSQVRGDYRVSIESFAKRVKEYIDTQPPGFRLNFFIDEVGQFVGQDSKRMLNLQTVTETLDTVCNGRAWVFVTSQADLAGVLGDFRGMAAQDISKIQGRFVTRMTLASADVREVIQKRLLAKTEAEPAVLTEIWDREKDNLQTLYRFGDGSKVYNGWRGSDEFCQLYPFHPYHFDLFQEAITQLSRHDAFTGKYLSVGERSMLAVFQEVAKTIREEQVGRLATFDRMYDGIAASLRGDVQTSIKLAENQLGDGLQLRVLKALFLLKWVREFKATPRNVAILLIDRPDLDIAAHDKAVKDALAALESQSYLQRNGDVFEFLTDVEKDIEKEIKSTDVDESSVANLVSSTLFADVLRDPKIRYDANGQDYAYARKLDDALVGKEFDIALNVITPEHPNHGDLTVLASQNMGRNELLAVLPADARLGELARLYLKTEKFIRQFSGSGDETRKVILQQRGQQNAARRKEMLTIAEDLLARAPIYLNGSKLDTIGTGEPRNRYAKAFQELVAFAYPNLRMLKGSYDESSLSKALLDPDDLLAGGSQPLSEAEEEVLTYVRRNQDEGQRTSIEEMVRTFGKRPYGWYPMALLTFVARLFRMGKVELRAGELLEGRPAFEALRSSRQHAAIRVRIQEQIDASKVTALKQFHLEFFDKANDGTDARSIARCTAEALGSRAKTLVLLADQSARYPFLSALKPYAERLEKLADRDHVWLLNNVADYRDELLDAKEDLIAPVEAFMHGAQRIAYDEAINFLREEAANFGELSSSEVEPLRTLESAEHPYRGTAVPAAKGAVARLRGLIADLLTKERDRALAEVDGHEGNLKAHADFAALDVAAQERVLVASRAARTEIQAARFVTGVRDRVQRFVTRDYPEQLTLAARLATPVVPPSGGGEPGDPTPPPPPPVVYISASRLRPTHAGSTIANEADLDEWLAALRAAAVIELKNGKRITL